MQNSKREIHYLTQGTVLGEAFTIVDIIDQAGTAVVYRASDSRTSKPVAVKQFYKDCMSPVFKQRIYNEVELARHIRSQFIVMPFWAFEQNGYYFTVQPYVEGATLRQRLDCLGMIEPKTAALVAMDMSAAGDDLVKAGVVSTDFKPENLIISRSGQAITIDTSCYEYIGRPPEFSQGTEYYAPPELLKRDCLTAATDVFSTGMTLFEMLLGSIEFRKIVDRWGPDLAHGYPLELSSTRHLSRGMSLDPGLCPIIERATHPKLNSRYSHPGELFTALGEYAGVLSRAFLLLGNHHCIPINSGVSVFGRNCLPAANPLVSEKHVELALKDGRLMIRDAGSTNGTRVNGMPIGKNWVEIHDTDVVSLANVDLRVKVA